MVYLILSVAITGFIYFNVLGLWRGYRELADSAYKAKLWKYKKYELIEKGVISAIFVGIVYSMKYFDDEIAVICLAAAALIMGCEALFGRFMRKALVCPVCGKPVWNGNFIVILQPRKYCTGCRSRLDGTVPEDTAAEKAGD